MSAIHGLSDCTKEILKQHVFRKDRLSSGCLLYDQMGRDPVGQELHEKTAAFNALTATREALVIAEIVTVVFSLAIAPLFFCNRREKIGSAAILIAGGVSLLLVIGFLFDRIHLSPNHKQKKEELDNFSKKYPIGDQEILDMHIAVENLLKLVKSQKLAPNLLPKETKELGDALQEVQDLYKHFTPPSWAPPADADD